ncbi:MAG: transglycosylase domain-containing protein, partial [Gammaproteobacteria bacterium]|nr:transglycosylase domain-containing protein [Gammaproteobacteria bacterium]
MKRLLKILGWSSLLAIVALAGYLVYVDRLITETFEGRRWTVPAVVFAEPLELYPGAVLSMADVSAELTRLGYEQRQTRIHPGAYQRSGDILNVHLRSFHFMERSRGSQRIAIGFAGPRISSISDSLGRPVPLIRLDPVTIGSFFPTHGEDRLVLTPEQVPELLREALKAVEDRNFDKHAGFDIRGIARAFWVNVTSGELKQGGSTLTQQLVKSYFLDNRRTLGRKLRELAMAVILDARFSKEDLLNAYINEIYLGQDGRRAVHGFGLGAQFYFNRPLTELNPAEIATLIAVIRGPSYYNPFRQPERARARRGLVLDKMLEAELIAPSEHQRAKDSPLEVVQGARRGGAYYPAFMDLARARLTTLTGDDLTSEGLRVFTTLQPRTQDAVELSIAATLDKLEAARELAPGLLQAAVIVTNTQTGEVVALSGGRHAGIDGFNRALNARRPVGSLLKPLVYLTALEQGYHLASVVQDEPVTVDLPNQSTWAPDNFDHESHGPVPLVRGLADSLNLATVQLGLLLGVDSVAARFEALTGQPPANPYPSLLLGAESLSPAEVSALYGMFASNGFYMPPKAVIAVLDELGAPISHHPFQVEQRIETEPVKAISRALEVVMQRGTGKSSRFAQLGAAGKTGTSDDYRDSWFAGYDDTLLTVVWVGYDDNTPTGLTGAAGALKVWD